MSKLKALTDENFSLTQIGQSFRIEKMIGKGGNAGYQHFLPFPLCFQKLFCHHHRKMGECPWARHFRAQPSSGETQESMNNVSCCRDMTEILLKAA